MNIFGYKRIMILGNNGSGKSYLSKELAAITGLPPIHLDVAFWRPNWVAPSNEEWEKQMSEFVSREKWIIDGIVSLGDTMDMRFRAAELVIFLDINRLTCLAGVIKRNGKKRSDTAADHEKDEKFNKRFLEFCVKLWRFPKSSRKRAIMDFHEKYSDTPFFVIKGRRQMNHLLKQWKAERLGREVCYEQIAK